MRRIRSKDTAPEMAVRRAVHAMGYRYRLHRKDLPGNPDLVFGPRRKAIFVHGCYWHQHPGCREGRLPSSNLGYWSSKLASNVRRDQMAMDELAAMGWKVLVVWECEALVQGTLEQSLRAFLET